MARALHCTRRTLNDSRVHVMTKRLTTIAHPCTCVCRVVAGCTRTLIPPAPTQLVEEGASDEALPIMQFGRVGKDAFNLDYQAPLTGLQAFGIALSAFSRT